MENQFFQSHTKQHVTLCFPFPPLLFKWQKCAIDNLQRTFLWNLTWEIYPLPRLMLFVFNKYYLNTINELMIQQANTESNKFSLQGAFHQGFPEIISIPITKSEVQTVK